jgi:hypothetical protein
MSMPATIRFPDVDASARRRTVLPVAEALSPLVGDAELEACGSRTPRIQPAHHGFAHAVRTAYDDHVPLVLSPDELWLAIVQGWAIAQRLATPKRRRRLIVRRDDFVPGQENPWNELFSAFGLRIRAHVGDALHDLLRCDFSTTGPLERVASDVVVMGALKNRFEYEFHTLCGIPSITLLGEPEDWRRVRTRARRLCERGTTWWEGALDEILEQFVRAAEGGADLDFWRSIYKLNDESGGPYLTGWLNVLLPFTERDGRLRRNPVTTCWAEPQDWGGGIRIGDLPNPLTATPVLWRYLDREIPLTFCAGFVGVEQDREGAVRPAVGWAVVRGELT